MAFDSRFPNTEKQTEMTKMNNLLRSVQNRVPGR